MYFLVFFCVDWCFFSKKAEAGRNYFSLSKQNIHVKLTHIVCLNSSCFIVWFQKARKRVNFTSSPRTCPKFLSKVQILLNCTFSFLNMSQVLIPVLVHANCMFNSINLCQILISVPLLAYCTLSSLMLYYYTTMAHAHPRTSTTLYMLVGAVTPTLPL